MSYIPAYTCSVSCENTTSSSYTMDTSHESAHERVAHTTIALAPLMPASPIARWRLCRCEQVNLVRGKKSRVSFPQFATRKHFGIFRFSPIFPSLLPPMNFPRSSRREIEGSMETNKYLYRCDRYRSFFKKERKKFAWTPHGSREGSSRRPRRQRMTPMVSVFHRFRFGHAARATRTHRVSAPTHARIYTCVGASPLLGSPPSSYRH